MKLTRVTQSMLVSRYLINTNRNLSNAQTLQNQIATGKEINRPSDNPFKANRIMQLYTEISANKQFKENIKDTDNWLDETDTALNSLNNVYSRIRHLLVTTGNGSYSDDERLSIQLEMKELNTQIMQILNTNTDGNYIFGGTKSTSVPLMIDSNGRLQLADKNGKAIYIYKDSNGDITTNPDAGNTAVSLGTTSLTTAALTNAQIDSLKSELESDATSDERKAEIKLMIGTRDKVYVKKYSNTLTTTAGGTTLKSKLETDYGTLNPSTMGIVQVSNIQNSIAQYSDKIKSELNDDSITSERKTELEKLSKDISTAKEITDELADLVAEKAGTINSEELSKLNTAISNKLNTFNGYVSNMYTQASSGPYYSLSNSTGTGTSCTVTDSTLNDAELRTKIESELNNTTNPPTDKRRAELNNILKSITPKVDTIYKTTKTTTNPDGTSTTTTNFSTSNQNTPAILSETDIKNLEDEYKLAATTSTRKEEIQNILVAYNQIGAELKVEVSEGVKMQYNTTALDIMYYTDSNGNKKSISDLMNQIINNLEPDGTIITNPDGTKSEADHTKVFGNLLTEMDGAIKQLLTQRSKVGAWSNRIESTLDRNKASNESMTKVLSKTEDIDYAEKYMEYAVLQQVYQASLQISGRILPMTLMDYVR